MFTDVHCSIPQLVLEFVLISTILSIFYFQCLRRPAHNYLKIMWSVIKKRKELICMKMLLDIELAKEMTIISGFHFNKK